MDIKPIDPRWKPRDILRVLALIKQLEAKKEEVDWRKRKRDYDNEQVRKKWNSIYETFQTKKSQKTESYQVRLKNVLWWENHAQEAHESYCRALDEFKSLKGELETILARYGLKPNLLNPD